MTSVLPPSLCGTSTADVAAVWFLHARASLQTQRTEFVALFSVYTAAGVLKSQQTGKGDVLLSQARTKQHSLGRSPSLCESQKTQHKTWLFESASGFCNTTTVSTQTPGD
ncbi:MAG: uncharacterized protein A8A55_2322 [Amphiamblys sp. WSBS2006]|nr:MAG: uncharacterized protein A8A55_2322 [Amphiamblys sp. WSBS2006]